MPIYSPTGFLDITNATLRTSNTECQNLQIGSGNVYVTTDLTSDLVLNLENITNLGATTSNTIVFSNVTTGLTVSSNIIVTGNVTAGTFLGNGSGLTALNATNVTTGTLTAARIPDLDAAKITTGTLTAARIPDLDAAKITTGTLPVARGGTGATGSSTGTGGVVLSAAPAFTGDVTFDTNTLKIDSTNNRVGIGTASPEAQLHIGPKDNDHIYLASVNNDYGWKIDTEDQGSGVVPFRIIKRTNDVDTTVLTIKNQDGNVGIGTTNPQTNLHIESSGTTGLDIYGGDTSNPYIFIGEHANNYTRKWGMKMNYYGNSNVEWFNMAVIDDNAVINALTIRRNGNVGIGTTSPSAKLQVGGNAETAPQYLWIRGHRVGTPGDISGIHFYNSAASGDRGNSRIINSRGANNYGSSLQFWTNPDANTPATQKMVILSTGNVGIGTASPNWPLEVSAGDNSITYYGPNTTWASYLAVGAADDKTIANNTYIAQCITTNGNLHLDAAHARDIYMNHYRGAYIRHGGSGLYSDDRLKSEEELITNATDTLLKLSPQKYLKRRTLREDETRDPTTETGLIAQDIWYDAPELRHIVLLGTDASPVEIKPEAPVEGDIQQDPDYSSWGPNEAAVNYDGLIAYLIKSNQELHARIQTLENA